MMSSIQIFLTVAVAAVLALLLWRQWQAAKLRLAAVPDHLFAQVRPLLQNAVVEPGLSAGSWKLSGRHDGQLFQLQSVVDTLATRKLPSLWLLVTLPSAVPVEATLDLMMRPAGPTTFSNFDFLPHGIATPAGFPPLAVLRTDGGPNEVADLERLVPHLHLFQHGEPGKELLISPKGLRIVIHAAEANRARYGVFREANFGETMLDGGLVKSVFDTLLALKADLMEHSRHE